MKSIVRSRGYLAKNRRSLLGRSIASAMAGALPIPLLDDWLVSSIRRSMIRRIADSHGVDLDDEAVQAIADGAESPPKWAEFLSGGLAIRLLSKQWKKLFVAVLAAKRAKSAADTFEVATLFDHYCARVHLGAGLDKKRGKELRARIDEARKKTHGSLSSQLFRRSLLGVAKGTAKTPIEVARLISGGRITKLLSKGSEIEATTEVDQELENHLSEKNSFLARSAAAIEMQLSVDSNPYLDKLIDRFDAIVATAAEHNHSDTDK